MKWSERGYRYLPTVRRVEYLLDFLQAVFEGYDRERAEQKLADRKTAFEFEKSRALGRGRPFMKKLKKTKRLRKHCLTLSTHIGFVKGKERLELTDEGKVFLGSEGIKQRNMLTRKLLGVYTVFIHIIMTLSKLPQVEVVLPMKKNNVIFVQKATRYGLKVGQTTFEVVRDLASQLDLMNWHPVETSEGRYEKVYLTCEIMNRGQADSFGIHQRELVEFPKFIHENQEFWIRPMQVEHEKFKQVLWEEYLKATKYVPRKPVFYSKLRSEVCYKLRINDRAFDYHAKQMMKSDKVYRLIGSGGSLPYSRDMASLLKSLPIKTERGEYIVYLKMDTKRGS